MEHISSLVFLVMGLLLGGLTTGFILRSRWAGNQAQSQFELIRLNERLVTLQEENAQHQQVINDDKRQIDSLRNELNVVQNHRTQLAERASRLLNIEQQLENATQALNAAQAQVIQLSTQLAERIQRQQGIEQRWQSALTSEQVASEKIERLQNQLQHTTNHSATLAEQVAYLPELQGKIATLESEQLQSHQLSADLREKIGAAETTINHQSETIKELSLEKEQLTRDKTSLTQQQQELMAKVAELTTQLAAERSQSGEKIALLNDAKTELSNQFKALANDILEEKSKRFTEQNQSNIEQLLNPLRTKLHEFQGKVEEVYVQEGKERSYSVHPEPHMTIEEVYVQEGKERSALTEQVKQLMTLNKQLSQDAHQLTNALKGQAKTQGNWGELILERVLEHSGLNKGEHYETQVSHSREDGTRAQPDVIINLPDNRHLIVDAKVSIVAYNDYANAETDHQKEAALKRHIESIRTHIKGLSSKNYQELYQLKSLDFVILFVPVEPAFMLAIAQDNNLWQEAWTKNVLLVSPSTLLFVVRTVANLWRQEQQTHNAQAIAKSGGELYDKLVGFVEDFEKIGDRVRQAQKSYDDALNKLSKGNGNIIKRAEKLKKMGVNPSKSLPASLIELAFDGESNAL